MLINALSFKGTELDAKTLEKSMIQPRVELKQENDKFEISNKKKKPVRSFGGSILALMGANLISDSPIFVNIKMLDKLHEVATFSGEDAQVVEKALKQTIVDSGLKEKGVRIKFLNPSKWGSYLDYFKNPTEYLEKIKLRLNSTKKPLRELISMQVLDLIRDGKNAAFISKNIELVNADLDKFLKVSLSNNKEALNALMEQKGIFVKANSILAPKGKIQSCVFHELGHAMNANLSKFGKLLQKSRPISLFLPGLLITYGAFTRKSKPKEENQALNGRQKTHNFIRDNAGKLTFLAFLPTLIEEGMATIKGQKFAKKLLKPELAKKVLKGNLLAYSTYTLSAIISVLSAWSAVKIKDKIIAKKEAKLALKAS